MKLKELRQSKYFQLFVVVAVLALGILLSKALIMSRKKPERKPRPVLAPLVIATHAKVENAQMSVTGFGTVVPKTIVKIIPQVSGIVVDCHDDFANGGFFNADEALITIEQDDYKFAVNNAEATVARAKVQLEIEQAQADSARREWDQLHPGTEPDSQLVLHGPQIVQAQAELKSAHANLAKAQLDLKRTVISLPFNGRIEEESGDIGQYVTKGQPIATVYSTDVVEIVVPLEDRDLAWFKVPYRSGRNSPKTDTNKGAGVEVTADFAGKKWTWQGRVVRIQGSIDSVSRMVNVVVEVEKPFEVSQGKPPLMPGMFVSIKIEGKKLNDVIRLPRHGVHDGNKVWVAVENELDIRTVVIDRTDSGYAYITSGLVDGELVVTSPIDAVTDGMTIRVKINSDQFPISSDQ